MSIPVDLSKLAEVMGRYRFAYLLSASERGAPHALAVTAVPQGGELVVNAGAGLRISARARRPAPARAIPRTCCSGRVRFRLRRN